MENKELKTLDDVIAEFYSGIDETEVSNDVWTITHAAGETKLYHNGTYECTIQKSPEGDFTVVRHTQLSSIPAMTARALRGMAPDKKVTLLDFEKSFDTSLDEAKYYIDSFCEAEYGDKADYSDLRNVGIAYTTLTDDELPVQTSVDLIRFKVTHEFDGEVFLTEPYDSLEDLIENQLKCLDFSDLVDVPDEVLEKHGIEVE